MTIPKKVKKKYYTVKRYVLEEYEVLATCKEDAKTEVEKYGNPYAVTVIKETIVKQKE